MLPESDPSLNPFFNPRGVALFGVSTNPAKLGYGIAQNLANSGYAGAIHFVNPKGGTLFGRSIHTDISEAPDPVDLAVILVPPFAVPATLEACGARGIQAAIIASGGFRETGPEGAELEDACLDIARQHNMRLIGPNCIGLLDTHLPLDTTFLPPPAPPAGEIAFISHSGAICAAIVDWSRGQGFGFSRLVSLGNQADVTETDILPAVAADPHTAVIALYLESISDGRRFVDIARQITSHRLQHKPIVALKVGRTAAGKKAAASHTGALAGREAAFDAALRRAGIQRAETAEQMFDWARALAWCPTAGVAMRNTELESSSLFRPPNSAFQVAILTNAGGPGVMAADAIEANGLALSALSLETQNRLRDLLAPAASVANPVDMLASASPEQYAQSLRLLLDDEEVNAVLVILPPPPMFSAGAVARAIMPLIQRAGKPVVVSLMGHGLVQEALAFLRAVKIPTYPFPERAASALAAVSRQRSVISEQEAVTKEQYAVIGDRLPAGSLTRSQSPHPTSTIPLTASGWLSQDILFHLLAAYGIRTPAYKIVSTTAEALEAAEKIGYPVAMKVTAPELTHKSDTGGVRLNLQDAGEVMTAFHDLSAKINPSGSDKYGLLIQQMIPSGQEIIVGVTRDAQFGPLLMFGSGGVEVEGLEDVAFALAPLSEAEARQLLEETWAGRKLAGYRDIPPADKTGVIEAILRVGRLAADYPQLAEIEINPLIVLGKGAIAVDGRARAE
jgi:acetyl coenzyme A synthetase (ADP forming)-like protein